MIHLQGRLAMMVPLLAAILITPTAPVAFAVAGDQGTGWHIDFDVYSTVGPQQTAAALRWDSTATLTGFEIDVQSHSVDLQYTAANGDLGTFLIWTSLTDGQLHRIHLDAAQSGTDVTILLTIGGWLAYPFVLTGQQIGLISHAVINPNQPMRATNADVSVDQLTIWSP